MPADVLLPALGALLLAATLTGTLVAYRRWLDHHEDWDPWAPTVTLPVVRSVPVRLPGAHRPELLTHPFRLPGWTPLSTLEE